jgi:hypothetical protein
MYRVIAVLPDGGFSITTHVRAIDAFSRTIDLRKEAATFYVEDGNAVRLSETELVARMAKEPTKP